MKRSIFNRIVAILSVLIMGASSTLAGPVTFFQVVHSIDNYQQAGRLRLWDANSGELTLNTRRGPMTAETLSSTKSKRQTTVVSQGQLLAGVEIKQDAQQKISISQGEIEGTLCDCGEILLAAGGFPKWPLLFLAGVPFLFIHGGGGNQPPVGPTPTPLPLPSPSPPAPPSIPEPGSLFLLLTGLSAAGAILQRRKRFEE